MIEVSVKCIGCTKCVPACPFGAIAMVSKKAVINLEACTFCGACVQVCPVEAISITREVSSKDFSSYKGVWVWVEFEDSTNLDKQGEIKKVSYELLSEGRKLADQLGQDLCAVALSDKNSNYEKVLGEYGADKVYLVENAEFVQYNTDIYSTAIMALINRHKPAVFLFGATVKGRDLAPRLAAALYVGLTADCTGLAIRDGLLIQSRPAFGGNIMADIIAPNSRPQMSTVRPNVMKISRPVTGKIAILIREDIKIDKNLRRVKILERKIDENQGGVKIENANIIVSGGRGMKNKEKFKIIEELAQTLGGVVGASRAAVDLGFKEKSHQVGQSGTTVSPRLYLAFGISGAVQHLVGMKTSDIIIAVNKDPNASIFSVAKYAVIGDAHEIAPKLIEALRKRKKG
ncbi:MAG: electron transfer flavoprotein subunit alpha [Elusimicrobia bacterium CG08_land_8_20_14_0_20_51_18]|nr:MAG: electron transfer flavoprotein subunit alpha [Elusimicrobia bacterium CG08_land_8_20_14_0_20_51_18]